MLVVICDALVVVVFAVSSKALNGAPSVHQCQGDMRVGIYRIPYKVLCRELL